MRRRFAPCASALSANSGWELHVPTEFGAHVYNTLCAAGAPHGIRDVGYRAIESLRLEKGYLYWSGDISPDVTPIEAGLGFRVHSEAAAATSSGARFWRHRNPDGPTQEAMHLRHRPEAAACTGAKPSCVMARPSPSRRRPAMATRSDRPSCFGYLDQMHWDRRAFSRSKFLAIVMRSGA